MEVVTKMKSYVKKQKYYPVTLTEAVFKKDTNKNLDKIFEEYDKQILDATQVKRFYDTLQKYSDILLNYQGEWDDDKSKIIERRQQNVGDFWLYKGNGLGDERITLDYSLCEPPCYIYVSEVEGYTGNATEATTLHILKSIHIPNATDIVKQDRYDVVIVGAGAGGIGAAYALKDSGLKVALVERLDVLGGTHCNGGVGLMIANPVGNWYKEIFKRAYDDGYADLRTVTTDKYIEVGSGTDFEKRWRGTMFCDPKGTVNSFQGSHLNINDYYFNHKYFNDLKSTIDIFLNHNVVGVETDGQELYQVNAINTTTGEKVTFVGDFFIDCSADAVLFTKNDKLKLGKDYYSGTDGRDRFNEEVYPVGYEADDTAINTIEPVWIYAVNPFNYNTVCEKPSTHMKKFSVTNKSNFNWTPPNALFTYCSRSYSTQMSHESYLKRTYDWNYADGEARAEYFNLKDFAYNRVMNGRYAGISKMLAVRESYRVACEKTVDQNYLTKQINNSNIASEKTMALSSWYVDIHNQNYYCVSNVCNGIPYEAMIPKCYKNVLVASRCYGASHIGLSSVRLVKAMLDLGYSAGKAMIDAVDNSRTDVRNVDTDAVQTATGIKDTMAEVQQYFYGSTVDYTKVS